MGDILEFWGQGELFLKGKGILEETEREDVAQNSMHTSFVLVQQETMADFFKIAGMPRVIGAVDSSSIPIRAPHNDEHMHVCHKGFHAINAMAECNAQLLFTNFACRWQGSVHDTAVFNGSMLHAHLEDGGGQNGWLLGDRGYGNQPYLLTPFRPDDVSTIPQRRYQKAHTKTMNTIERAFGLCKSRFRCINVSGGAIAIQSWSLLHHHYSNCCAAQCAYMTRHHSLNM